MASGSSGRTGSGSKGFDFGSDDILCSYDDMINQDGTNGKHSDPVTGTNSAKGYRERAGKSFTESFKEVYTPREESANQDLIATVEKTMKKYADNLLRFLEGISARLQQLELYCYNLEKSIEEMRSDLTRENSEADSKLRSLEKHLQEVHRSVQILRDKQELAETQKELAKLHLVQKDSTANPSQPKEDGIAPSASDAKQPDHTQEVQSQQLALALPHQINPSMSQQQLHQHQPMLPSSQTPPQNVHTQTQQRTYYQQNQLPTMPPQGQGQHHPQDHYLQVPQQQPQPPVSHVTQPQQVHQFPPQWTQQVPQQVQQQPQQPTAQPQMGPQTTPVYPPYQSAQSVNPSPQTVNPPPETFPGSMPLQVQFSGVPQPGMSRIEPAGYGYAAPTTTRPTVQQQSPPQNIRQPPAQTLQNTYGMPLSDGAYAVPGPHPTQPSRQGYMMYDGEGGRVPHPMPPHFSQGGYPPSHVSSLQNQQPIRHSSPSQVMRSHPYSELIEKVVSMGYGRDFVTSVIHRMDESGQPVDFNSVLDKLNVHSSGGSQRGWSG